MTARSNCALVITDSRRTRLQLERFDVVPSGAGTRLLVFEDRTRYTALSSHIRLDNRL